MDDRIVDRALCAAAAVLGVALFAAAVVHLSAPVGVQPGTVVAKVAPAAVPGRPAATLERRPARLHATVKPRHPKPPVGILAARGVHPIPRPTARVALAAPPNPAERSIAPRARTSVAALKPAKRSLGRSRSRPRIDPDATPEPPVGYDPHPAIAGVDIVAAPPSTEALPPAPVSFHASSRGR